jgi:hypothetical protein
MIRLSLALAIGLIGFTALLDPIYGNCKDTAEGRSCDLIGYSVR